MDNLKIFVCDRSEEGWEGALIVGAEDIKEAKNICTEAETEPYSVKELPLKKGIIYNDERR